MIHHLYIPHFNQKIRQLLFLVLILLPSIRANANADSLVWIEWLTPGLSEVYPPAFADEVNLKGNAFTLSDHFSNSAAWSPGVWPFEGMAFERPNKPASTWAKVRADRSGKVSIGENSTHESCRMGYAAAYIVTKSYQEIKVTVTSSAELQLMLNDEPAGSAFPKKGAGSKLTKTLKLEPGKHKILLTGLLDKQDSTAWSFNAYINPDTTQPEGSLSLTTDASRPMDLALLLDGPRVQGAWPSFDGSYILLRYSDTRPPEGKTESWYEIIQRESGRTVFPRGSEISRPSWSPISNVLAFTRKLGDKDVIVLLDLATSVMETKASISELSGFRWAPDGSYLICTITEKDEKTKDGFRKYENMSDRTPWWRTRSFLLKLDLVSGRINRLSWGHLGTRLEDIRFDGKAILISSSEPDYSNRPFSKNHLYELQLADNEVDTLLHSQHGFSATYAPDGKSLLMTGSPSLFGMIGTATPDSAIPNDYDTQLYHYELATGKAKCLSLKFDPTIEGATWNAKNGKIFLLAEDKTFHRLFVYDPSKPDFVSLSTVPDVIEQWSLSANGEWIGHSGSSLSLPDAAYLLNTRTGKQQIISDPEKETFSQVKLGNTDEWDFMYNGSKIEGRVYFPPDFDPTRRYPLIVYYYGGTNPTVRDFRGRYPKHLFAANGYVVYVLQPSGATGYGQEFSARHVNNWGKTVADEIIGCTRGFLAAHSFIDTNRVGCIGASYGGFMTMLLITRTKMFSAAISHAGISSIASYWGEGYWGYSYSSAASAGSYPWNNKDLYVEQSPLFHADKVTTPLLLLHGGSDTNVPPGESIQMFTALKLLGKTVEYIEIEGQDHHILDYRKRLKWQKTILAWFDLHLKGESGWWKALYPEKAL